MEKKYSIDIESFLSLPAHVYWKDAAGFYLGCNDLMAENLCLANRHEITGKSDFDTQVTDTSATNYRQQDQFILNTKQTKSFIDLGKYKQDSWLAFSTLKQPLYNQNEALIGVFGISTIVNTNEISRFHEEFLATDQNHFQIPPEIKTLSMREKQCVFYAIKGYSANSIAGKLDLSKRTVETYLNNAKNKLGCLSLNELTEYIIDKNYILFLKN